MNDSKLQVSQGDEQGGLRVVTGETTAEVRVPLDLGDSMQRPGPGESYCTD